MNVTIGNSVTEIGYSAFERCESLTSIIIPNSVISLGYSAFEDCSGLVDVTIGNSVIKIYGNTFDGCKSLVSITIPNSVTSLGNYVFYNCSGLVNVTLGSSVTGIGKGTFAGCSSLTELYSYNITPPSVGSDNFTNDQYMSLNVYVPNEALGTYQNADTWNSFWNLQGFEYTGIETVKMNNKSTDKYYDLRGNRLDTPKRGLNIINGKKVIMK